MSTPALFDIPEDGEHPPQRCNRCPAVAAVSLDALRARGWTVFDGQSLSGATLKVRICPLCVADGETAPVDVDWLAYRRCRICQAVTGRPCTSHSREIIDGQPDGVRTDLDRPHKGRRLRVRRAA